MPKEEIELAINASSVRRVKKISEEALGTRFWKNGYDAANKEMAKYLRKVHKVQGKEADLMARTYTDAFERAASAFGDDLANAAEVGADSFQASMKKAIDRISKLQEKTDDARADRVDDIVKQELSGLRERLRMERKVSGERERAAETANAEMDNGPGLGHKARKMGGLLKGGLVDEAPGGGGGAIGAVAKLAGGGGKGLGGMGGLAKAAGPYMAIASALGEVAKALYEVQKFVKGYNQKISSAVSATDVMGAGFGSVSKGINSVRTEFMENIDANIKWRISAEKGIEALNSFTSAGLGLNKMLQSTGDTADTANLSVREFAEMNITWATVMGTSTGEVGKFVTDMMLDMTYSLDQVKQSMSAINKNAVRTGMSTSRFFATVQSVNSQLDLMNGHLKTQSKVLADTIEKSALGAKDAVASASTLMGKLDFDTAAKSIAYAAPEMVKTWKKNLAQINTMIQNPGQFNLDPKAVARMKQQAKELEQAIADPVAEGADYMASGLATETDNMGARLAVLSKMLGKNLDTLNSKDVAKSLDGMTFDQRQMLKQFGIFGSTEEEVTKNVMGLQAVMEGGNGTAEDTLDAQRKVEMAQGDQLSAEEQAAQDQLQATEDVGIILTDIKELIYSKIYNLMLDIYDLMPGQTDRKQILASYDRSSMEVNDKLAKLGDQLKTANPDEKAGIEAQIKELQSIGKRIDDEKDTIQNASDEEVGNMLDSNQLTAKTFAQVRLGEGVGGVTKGQMGGAEDVYAKKRGVQFGDLQTDAGKRRYQQTTLPKAVADYKANPGKIASAQADAVQTLKDNQMTVQDSIAEYNRENPVDPALASTGLTAFNTRMQASPGKSKEEVALDVAREMGLIEMAKGGVVTKPTMALIGEAGPEAVVPLGGRGGMGGVTININGGDLQAVRREVGKALQMYDKSQRV